MDPNDKGLLILMADGNIDEHNIVKKAARQCELNHVFTSMYNGSQLMDYLKRRGVYSTDPDRHPDLLLMDIHLDIVQGFEILRYLHTEHPFKFPVYVLSRNRSEDDAIKAANLGVKDFLQKPVNSIDWQKMISRICEENFKKSFDR